ncbi:MAG: hypothetical protein LBD79_02745 [Treponema sp.]|jgi:hypothetical protein|nr:hypothetical protein [Treponema sp.]
MKHKLPVDIQNFISLRQEGCLYVDKTARIHEDYLLPWRGSVKTGVNFDHDKRTIGEWLVENNGG